MIAFEIKEQKKFMEKLLCTNMFHHFLLEEAVIHSAAAYTIDGHINRAFYNGNETELTPLSGLDCLPFSMLQKQVFSMISGAHTPTAFKLIFSLSPQTMENTVRSLDTAFTVHDINGLYLNLHFKEGRLIATPAVSYCSFSLDRSLEKGWEKLVRLFLSKNEVPFTED